MAAGGFDGEDDAGGVDAGGVDTGGVDTDDGDVPREPQSEQSLPRVQSK